MYDDSADPATAEALQQVEGVIAQLSEQMREARASGDADRLEQLKAEYGQALADRSELQEGDGGEEAEQVAARYAARLKELGAE
ncbi:hypothetical protein QIS99_28175 [Streptomyces sp. B-S-A8]|uniref:Uncharacterized protein n=1 Tax=Streptomyces solicavernae TaxID=3043614 RepID=A0ABT6S038_9ACTN|nr:hypothetical protein [Streptomyces sp. B-S-A8]MDI3390040.1 hypothetical protein [Streptomyces sp. B-S-A8]